MSETIDITIRADTKDAIAQVDALTRSLKETEKESQKLTTKEKQRVQTLREEYRELRRVHEQLHTDVLRGRATNRTKYQVGDQGKFTIKQLRERINLTKALIDIEEKNIRKSSFAKAKSDYTNNLKAIVEGKRLLRQIEDRSSESAKKLSADIANATKRNKSIETRWGGYDDFAEHKQNVLADIRKRTTLGDAKKQAAEEARAARNIATSQKNLSAAITRTKTEIGQLAYAYQKGSISQSHYTNEVKRLRKEYDLLKKATNDVNKITGQGGFDTFGKNVRSHLHWIVSGALVDKLTEIPVAIKDIAVEFDNLERKIAQNIELSGKFENNHDELAKASKGLVYSSLDIANYHGMKVEEVLEMMQIMSRRFKDPAELKYFTNLAATMSKLDFVEPKVAAETLEAVVLSFGLTAKQTADFVNEFSIATHTMRINGQDLLEALQRSAPMLRAFGMSTAESVAMVSTLSTTLGREGKYIGNAVTGMFSRLLRSGNREFFKNLGISFEDANGKAKQGIEIMREYLEHYQTLNENARRSEVNDIFGAYRVVPGLANFDAFELFEKSLREIKEKASDSTTAKLEREQRDSHESKINRFYNSLHMLAYVLSDEFSPAAAGATEGLSRIILALVDFIKNHRDGVEILGKFIIVCTTASMVLNVLGKGMSFASSSTAVLNKVLNILKAILAYNNTLLAAEEIQLKKNTTATVTATTANKRFGDSFVSLAGKIGMAIGRFAAAAAAITIVLGLMDAIATKVDLDERRASVNNYVKETYGGFDKIPDDDPKKKMLLKFQEADNDYNNNYVTRAKLEEQGVYLGGKKSAEEIYQAIDESSNDLSKQIAEEKYMKKFSSSIELNNPLLNRLREGDIPATEKDDTGKADKEVKDKERREKSVLGALVSRYKTEAELSQKTYDSLMADIGFEQEIFGVNPKNVSQSLYAKASRQEELRSQIASRNRFIEELRAKYDAQLGDYQYSPSANFEALQDEMTKTIGKTYESAGLYIKEMLAKVGASITNTDLTKQAQEFKDKGKFFTDFSKIKLGDTIYWNGSDDAENTDINYAGVYMGNNAVQFAGENGVGSVSLADVKGIQGYGSTGVGDLKAEDLEAIGNDNPMANILAEYLKKIDEMEKLNESEKEKVKEIGRELKRGYLISDDKRFEEQKSRLKTEEDIALLDNTNRVNAYNHMVLTNKKLEYAQKNLAVLQEEYKKAVSERMDWAKRLSDLESEATDNMTKEQLEAHEIAVNTARRNLELAKDTEAQRLLAVKKTNDEIEQLEYQRTQKIKEGLHGVVHDLLLEGKSWKDIWSQLWSDLADEALRALMGIENGQQSTLGAIAAKAFGLDKENPNGEMTPQIESVNTNTSATERNTAALMNLTNTLGSGQGSQTETQNAASITQSVADAVKDTAPKWADEVDTVSSAELARRESKNKDAMQMLTALGVVGAAASMSGSRKLQKFGALLSIATPFVGRGKKLSHSGSIVGVTPMATRYYHNGGMVGTAVTPYLKSDEVNAVLQTGEEVVSRKDRRTSEIMSEQNKYMADAMERMSSNSNTNVTFAIQAIDSKSVVQLLNENGDAIMNILRKQSAYGNGRM